MRACRVGAVGLELNHLEVSGAPGNARRKGGKSVGEEETRKFSSRLPSRPRARKGAG